MAYELRSENSTISEIHAIAGAAKTVGEADLIDGKLGFWPNGAENGELQLFIFGAKRLLVDADDAVTFSQGNAVYDAGTPTGEVNKTATAGRRLVGYALKTYAAGTAQIEVENFDGTRDVTT
jgi:hypothetical protein